MNERTKAKSLLSRVSITSNQSWASLDDAQRVAITEEARTIYQAKYGRPMPTSNEAFVRKRFELLQQRAHS